MSLRSLRFLDAHVGSPGGMLQLRGRPAPRILVWHPDVIDRIFRSDQHLRHPGSRSLTPLLGARSLLWADGPRHVAYRQVLGPPLRGRRLTAYQPILAEAIGAAVAELVPDARIALSAWTRRLTLRIAARIILGRCEDAVLARFTDWLDRALGGRRRTLAYRYLTGGLPRSSAALDRQLVNLAHSNVDTRPATLAALLLESFDDLDDGELRDAVVSLLFAGHETTAAAAAWTLYWLDRNPRVCREVRAEVAAGATDGSDPARVPVLHAVIQEALRLTPPVTVAGNRALTEPAELLDRSLPAGTVLTPSIYLAHRHPDRFPDPRRFDPARFLGARALPQHFFPFGGGSRYCLGNQLAQLELRMITTAVLRRCVWHSVDPRAAVPRLRGHAMAPDPRLRMRILACTG